jgi:hypothetical protein
MNDQPKPDADKNPGCERSNRASVAGWTAAWAAFFAAIALINEPTWPVAFGVSVVTLAVMVVCCCILKRG